MRLPWKIAIGVSLISIVAAIRLFSSNNRAQVAAEKTRRDLQREGFKVDFSEWNFTASPEARARAADITLAAEACRSFWRRDMFMLMRPVATNAAIPVFQQEHVTTEFGTDFWSDLRSGFQPHTATLDRACAAALAGKIEFEPVKGPSGEPVFTQPGDMRAFALALSSRTLVDLHDGHRPQALTNLLALTCLVTRWQPGPAEISQMVRMSCIPQVMRTTWEAFQFCEWTDDELGLLQREWEQTEFLKTLPETAAFERANVAFACRRERAQPTGRGVPLKQVVMELGDSPARAWSDFTAGAREEKYRETGIFEDERVLLLYYRDQETQLYQALNARTWLAMRSLPGVTNIPSAPQFTERQLSLINSLPRNPYFVRPSFATRVAEAEARRRLLVTAIALERYKGRHHNFPESLDSLVPELLKTAEVDFIDGEPLRYKRTEDGRFLCYSIGIDCIDQGGQMTEPESNSSKSDGSARRRREPDLVWPLPATRTQIEIFNEQDRNSQKERQAQPRRRYGLAPRAEATSSK